MTTSRLPPGVGPFLLDVARAPAVPASLADLLPGEGTPPRGVLHVGAHYGQEIETYLACGFDPIILIEANPVVFERLSRHVAFWRDWIAVLHERYGMARLPRIIPIQTAASDRCGHAALHVAEHDPQSSILAPLDPQIRARGTIEVVCGTLDRILADQGVPSSAVGMLSMDVQGAEGMVLAGASELLREVDIVLTEVSYEPRYRRGVSAEEIDGILTAAGFEETFRTGGLPGYPVADVLYKRRKPGDGAAVKAIGAKSSKVIAGK